MKRRPVAAAPFTLIELLAIISIIVIMAGIVVGAARSAQRKAARGKARSEIAKFEIALQAYQRDHGYLPPTPSGTSGNKITRSFLQSLQSPGGKPYLNLDELRFASNEWGDPYGDIYRYENPGARNPESYDVWSRGNDPSDDDDDIGNFKTK